MSSIEPVFIGMLGMLTLLRSGSRRVAQGGVKSVNSKANNEEKHQPLSQLLSSAEAGLNLEL